MNPDAALAWLFSAQHHGIKLGLETIARLVRALGLDLSTQRFVHVAGTNGKGSVCAMIASVARADGLHVGLYTSPHLIDFGERIQIDGTPIPPAAIAEGLTRLREIVHSWETPPTFFELTTALAFRHFATAPLDLVILETGMGGRLDATNIVRPVVSVLTRIDLDHQAWLGDTLRAIAAEKAGIIKPGVPVVSAPQEEEVRTVILETAAAQNAPVAFLVEPDRAHAIGLPGSHQRWNAALAHSALATAGFAISPGALATGLRRVDWPGRFEIVGDRLILDGAHNPAAARQLAATWREFYGDEQATLILGILRDKEMDEIIRALLPLAARVFTVPVLSARTATAGHLTDLIRAESPTAAVFAGPDLATALPLARAHPERILICGSLFLVGEARALLRG